MPKRKVESDEDDDWSHATKKPSSRTTGKRVSRTTTTAPVATLEVKNEELDEAVNALMGSAMSGPSASSGQSTSSAPLPNDAGPVTAAPPRNKKRVKKETDEPAEEKRLARIRKSCPKVSWSPFATSHAAVQSKLSP